MSLYFKRVEIRNFGPYRDTQHLDLMTSSESPVVLVFGENTLGKTQLFSALRWCLYGTFTPQQTKARARVELPDRLNRAAARDGDDTFEVSIDFEANGDQYSLTRRAQITDGLANSTADLRVGATVFPAAAVDEEIGRLLHPQISEFFLFDAELLQRFYDRLASPRERDLIQESIETVLGIPGLQRARSDVGSMVSDALRRQAKEAKHVKDADRFEAQLRRLTDEGESVERDRHELEARLSRAREDLATVRQELRLVESLQADVREQETLEAQFADARRDIESLREEMRTLLGKGWKALALRPVLDALDIVQEQNTKYTAHAREVDDARARVAVLEERSRGGACPTCDQPLPPPDDATAQQLLQARERLEMLKATSGGGSLNIDLERKLSRLIDRQSLGEYARLHKRVTEQEVRQYERKQRLEGINDRLQGNKAADIRALGQRNKALEEAIQGIEEAQEANEARASRIAAEQKKVARQLERLPGAKPEIVFEAGFLRFVEAVLGETIAEYRETVRAKVEADASAMFLNLVRDPEGYGGLRISSNFQVELLDTLGDARPTSEGGKQLLALALIGALKHAAVRGGPVVLDSPLGRLDLHHRANVLQTWIPSLGAQAVLLVHAGELTKEDASSILGTRVGQAYEIVRPTGDPEIAVIEKAS